MTARDRAMNNHSSEAGDGECDRVCLEGLIDQYLSALVAHDPSRLPLAEKCKFTENDQVLELGDALWGTVSGPGAYKLTFADTQAGQAGFMGTVRENDRPASKSSDRSAFRSGFPTAKLSSGQYRSFIKGAL